MPPAQAVRQASLQLYALCSQPTASCALQAATERLLRPSMQRTAGHAECGPLMANAGESAALRLQLAAERLNSLQAGRYWYPLFTGNWSQVSA